MEACLTEISRALCYSRAVTAFTCDWYAVVTCGNHSGLNPFALWPILIKFCFSRVHLFTCTVFTKENPSFWRLKRRVLGEYINLFGITTCSSDVPILTLWFWLTATILRDEKKLLFLNSKFKIYIWYILIYPRKNYKW